VPKTFPREFLKSEFIKIADAIETGDRAAIRALVTSQNINICMINPADTIPNRHQALHHAIYAGRCDSLIELLLIQSVDVETKTICDDGKNHDTPLAQALKWYSTRTKMHGHAQYHDIILLLLKNKANVLDDSVIKSLEAINKNGKHKDVYLIQLINQLIKLKTTDNNQTETMASIADLYEKLNEPEEAAHYYSMLKIILLQQGLNQRDGLNNTEKNTYYAIATFEATAKQYPFIAPNAYYESFLARCDLAKIAAQDQSEMIAAMQNTHDILLANYKKFSIDQRNTLYLYLHDLLTAVSQKNTDGLTILKLLSAYFEKEADASILKNIKENLKKTLQSADPSSVFYTQTQKVLVQCFLRPGCTDLDIEEAIKTYPVASTPEDKHYLSQLYVRLGEASHGQKAVDAFLKAANLGNATALLSAAKAAEKDEKTFEDALNLYAQALEYFIDQNNVDRINEMKTLLDILPSRAFLTARKMQQVNALRETAAKYLENKKLKSDAIAAEQAAALRIQNEKIEFDKLVAEQAAVVNAESEAEKKEFELITSLDTENFTKIQDELIKIFKNSKIYKNKILAAKVYDKTMMKFMRENYKKMPLGGFALSNYLPSVAALMNHYLDRSIVTQWVTNSVRRNLFLCAKVVLLALDTKKAAIRFDIAEADIIAMVNKASGYLEAQSADKAKYPPLAKWYRKLIVNLQTAKRFIMNPDNLVLNEATGESNEMRANFLYGAQEAYRKFSEDDLKRGAWFPESLEEPELTVASIPNVNLLPASQPPVLAQQAPQLSAPISESASSSVYPALALPTPPQPLIAQEPDLLDQSPYLLIGRTQLPATTSAIPGGLNLFAPAVEIEPAQNKAPEHADDLAEFDPLIDEEFKKRFQNLFAEQKTALTKTSTITQKKLAPLL